MPETPQGHEATKACTGSGRPRRFRHVGWTAVTAPVMFALAAGKARTGTALDNPVLKTEGRVTLIGGLLAAAVVLGLVLNSLAGLWWADPAAGYVLVC